MIIDLEKSELKSIEILLPSIELSFAPVCIRPVGRFFCDRPNHFPLGIVVVDRNDQKLKWLFNTRSVYNTAFQAFLRWMNANNGMHVGGAGGVDWGLRLTSSFELEATLLGANQFGYSSYGNLKREELNRVAIDIFNSCADAEMRKLYDCAPELPWNYCW